MANLLVIGFTVGLCLLVAAVLRSLQWLDDRAEARDQARADRARQQREQRLADIQARLDQCRIDDTELADALARWSDDMHKQQREEG